MEPLHRVAIIGGGITGLTCMNLFKQLNIEADLFEKKSSFTEKGSGLLLGMNAMKILKSLNLDNEVLKHGQILHRITQATLHGSILTDFDVKKSHSKTGLYTTCISRPDLHSILAKNLKNVLHNKELIGATKMDSGKIQLEFMQGKSKTYDFIVGADGIHSTLRKNFCADVPLRYSGYTCWRFLIDCPPSWSDSEKFLSWEIIGPGRRFGIFPMGKNKVYCFTTLQAPENYYRNQPVTKSEFCNIYRDFTFKVPAVLQQFKIQKNAELTQRDISDLKYATLTSPQHPIVLAGDAGHATTPNLGQGAAMGMESAWVLSRLMAKSPLSPLLIAKEFEKKRKKRVEAIRRQSLFLGKVCQWKNPVACGIRNLLMKSVPNEAGRIAMQKLLLSKAVFSI